MLERWLKLLEDKEKNLFQDLSKLTADAKTLDLAQKEIKINAQSVRNYLRRLSEDGKGKYLLRDNLSEVRELYDGPENYHYRFLTNRIGEHLGKMEEVIEKLRSESFKPEFAHHY